MSQQCPGRERGPLPGKLRKSESSVSSMNSERLDMPKRTETGGVGKDGVGWGEVGLRKYS